MSEAKNWTLFAFTSFDGGHASDLWAGYPLADHLGVMQKIPDFLYVRGDDITGLLTMAGAHVLTAERPWPSDRADPFPLITALANALDSPGKRAELLRRYPHIRGVTRRDLRRQHHARLAKTRRRAFLHASQSARASAA